MNTTATRILRMPGDAINTVFRDRGLYSCLIGAIIGAYLMRIWPWSPHNMFLEVIHFKRPDVYLQLEIVYKTMLFTTPSILAYAFLSTASIFLYRPGSRPVIPVLPPFPDLRRYREPVIVMGEVHHPRRPVPIERPKWLTIPRRGLQTGIAIFGAIGSGKTSGCILPWLKQLIEYEPASETHRVSGLVLEVKGDLCGHVQRMLKAAGRSSDYIEIGFNSRYRYNPLQNDLDPYASAYGIASLMNNLFGKGKEPFWQQAYTNMIKFVILLHKIRFDYVTLYDVYTTAISPARLSALLDETEQHLNRPRFIEVPFANPKLVACPSEERDRLGFELDESRGVFRARSSPELKSFMAKLGVDQYTEIDPALAESPDGDQRMKALLLDQKRRQLDAVRRWFHDDWRALDQKLRSSITEGISVFLSLFDDNPDVKRIFCPPKELYEGNTVADDPDGIPLPPFAKLIEEGKFACLNFPVALNPGLAKAIGTMMKLDFQRAALLRIPLMEASQRERRNTYFRDTVFVCDEYQHFATVGGNDPNGDEKFFSLSRQAKCIPIVATQSISSLKETLPNDGWRTLLQTFRTKVFLAQSDEFSIQTAASLCGKEDRMKVGYSVSEASNDARVSLLTGKTTANKSTVTASKNYTMQKEFIFDERSFALLKNGQAIVMPFDGVNQLEPCYVYLKPWFLDRNKSYWQQLEDGEL